MFYVDFYFNGFARDFFTFDGLNKLKDTYSDKQLVKSIKESIDVLLSYRAQQDYLYWDETIKHFRKMANEYFPEVMSK